MWKALIFVRQRRATEDQTAGVQNEGFKRFSGENRLKSDTLTSTDIFKHQENIGKMANVVWEKFQLKKPRHDTRHWEGKLVRIGTEKEKGMAVLTSGALRYREDKFLETRIMRGRERRPTGTGSAQLE